MFKLQIFSLTEYDKCIYLDADMIVQKNIDHLFERPSLSAVAAGRCIFPQWTKLNSGLLVFKPDLNVYDEIIKNIEPTIEEKQANEQGFGDQDILHRVFKSWENHPERQLDERYNAMIFCLKDVLEAYNLSSINDLYVLHYATEPKLWKMSCFECVIDLAKDLIRKRNLTFRAKIRWYIQFGRTYFCLSKEARQETKVTKRNRGM